MNDNLEYNVGNNANDQWEGKLGENPITGTVVETIDKDKLPHVTKPGCEHKTLRRDDTEDDFVSFLCTNCPMGWLFKKQSS
jgi:hypothetical protein